LPQKDRVKGDAEAKKHLWMSYALGYGVGKNSEKMLEWMEKEALAGQEPGTMFLLGTALEKRNPEAAAEWMLKAAKMGNAQAIMQMARMYNDGVGTPVDEKMATEWLKRGVEQGIPQAMVHLGNTYYLGRGIEKNMEKAEECYKKAADTCDEETLKVLRAQGYQC
jgi:TPR repeat protein